MWTIACKFQEFLSLHLKRGRSYVIYRISFSYKKIWTIICNSWNFFLFSKNMDYHMHFMEFLSFLQKHGLSYSIFGISIPSSKTWTITCKFKKLLSLLQKRGL